MTKAEHIAMFARQEAWLATQVRLCPRNLRRQLELIGRLRQLRREFDAFLGRHKRTA